jgi:hypothetical protein
MDDGGFQSPLGRFRGIWVRRQHTSGGRHGCQYSVERALSASTLLPTAAFAALSAMTVLVVTQMGMSPLGALVGPAAPSARDGGLAVTSPRMSISIAPPLVSAQPHTDDRAPTSVHLPPTTIPVALAVRPEANPAAPVVITVRPEAKPAAQVVVAVLTRSTKEPVAQPVPQSPQGQFASAATLATTTAMARSAVNVTAVEPPKPSVSDQPTEASRAAQPAQPAEAAQPANDAKADKASDRVEQSRAG